MPVLTFLLSGYEVRYKNVRIPLLRKEYFLLQFLYEHAGQVFSRDQLLDAVWPMETPTDRTVDDHIYRVRKKLKELSEELAIKTVKGHGYTLKISAEAAGESAPQDQEISQMLEDLMKRYHLFGQGEAMNTLLEQKHLGFTIPEEYESIYAFMKGDAEWFLNNRENIGEKLYFLNHIYHTLSGDYGLSIRYIQTALKKELFTKSRQYEAETIGLLYLYVLNQDLEKAFNHYDMLTEQFPEILERDHGFYSHLMNTKCMMLYCDGQHVEFHALLNMMKRFFNKNPYQRELGIFYVINGVVQLKEGSIEKGRSEIERGYQVIQQTKFKSHLFFYYEVTIFLLDYFQLDEALRTELIEKSERLKQKHISSGILSKIKKELDAYI